MNVMTSPAPISTSTESLYTHRFRAMNTEVEVILPESHRYLAQTAETWFRQCESIFSRFDPDSELRRINRSAGAWVFVSPWMAEVLELARHYWLKTGGLFSPFLLDALEKAGYSKSFETIARGEVAFPAASHPEAASPVDPHAFRLYPNLRLLERPAGVRIDLGGIAKGWSAQRLARRLQKELSLPRGLINAGGDLYAWGGYSAGEDWSIGVQHPDGGADIATVRIHGGALATSSTMTRRWCSQEGVQHHIIDPRTGKPSKSDLVQCTVASPSLVEAEVLAKVILILGQKDGAAFLKRYMESENRPLAALLVTDNGKRITVTKNGITQQSEVLHS